MEDTKNSSSGRGQCPALRADGAHVSVNSSGEVSCGQGDCDKYKKKQGCHRCEPLLNAVKHKIAVDTHYKQRMQKILQKWKSQPKNEQNSFSDLSNASIMLLEGPADVRIVDQLAAATVSHPVASTGSKEHTINRDGSDTKEKRPHIEVTFSDLCNKPSCNFPLPDDTFSSDDLNRESSCYRQSGTQDGSFDTIRRNRVESLLAHFVYDQIALGPEDRNFCAHAEDYIKFLEILDFIKSCDGAICLLWNFIHEHIRLPHQQEVNVLNNTDNEENKQEDLQEEGVYFPDLRLDLHANVDQARCHEPTRVDYILQGDVSEESAEVFEEDRGSCTDVSDDWSIGRGDKEVAEHSDNELHLCTVTHGGAGCPHEEIRDGCNEQRGCNSLYRNNSGVSGTRPEEEFNLQSYLNSSGKLPEVISDFTLREVFVPGSDDDDDDDDDGSNGPLLYEGISMKMVSVGIQTEQSVSCEEYSSTAQTYSNKKIQVVLHKKKRPYRISLMLRQRKRIGRINVYPYKGVTYRYRPCVKGKKVDVVCPKEESDGVTSHTVCSSDVNSEHDTHHLGDACYIAEQSYDDERYEHNLIDSLKWGDTGGLKDSLSCIIEPDEGMRTGLTGSGAEAENISDACTEVKQFNVAENDNILVVETSCETVSGCPVSPKTELTNEDETRLVTGDIQTEEVSHHEVKEKILDLTLVNGEVNESHMVQHEEERKQETGNQECPVWQILRHFECPFKWVPDIFINRTPNSVIQENIITHLTEKEKEFSRTKCSIFREVVIYLILVYEKTLEDRFMEAIVDLRHCYAVLGNPQIITSCNEASNEQLDLSLVKGNYHFNQIKHNRTNLYHDNDEKVIENDPSLNNGMSYDDDDDEDKILNKLKPSKLTESGQCVSPNAELLIHSSKVEISDQENVTVSVSGISDISTRSFDVDVKCVNHDGDNSQVKGCKSISINGEENMYNPEMINAAVVATESGEENGKTMNSNRLQADVVQETEYDSSAVKGFKKDKPVGEESETERQEQRLAALEYVVNATLAHVAYFSDSSQEAYNLAKHIEHTYEQLGDAGKATVAALRGAMLFEYGYTGNKLGLQFLQKALELDPEYWEWNLYCGKVMSRIRQVEKYKGGPPGQEEVRLLEKAVQLNREDASVLVHLANVYRGLSHFRHIEKMEAQAKAESAIEARHYVRNAGCTNWRRKWSQPGHSQEQEEDMDRLQRWRNPQQIPVPRPAVPLEAEQKDYLQLAKELFLEALKKEPHCPYNNARCAKALWSMPVPYKDKECAKEAILRALTMAPDDSLVNHYAGLFYEYFNDYDKALICYKRATHDSSFNYPAEMNYISLKMKTSPQGNYNPLFRLDELLSKYSNPSYTVQILCHRGFYLYMTEKQYFQAIRNFVRAIQIDPGNQALKMFCPWKFYGRNISYNMYDLFEKIVAEYKNLPDGLENTDFIEETLETIRCLREKHC